MRSNKWLILGLVASVGVNIALAGYLAGRASHGPALRHIDSTVGFMRVLRNLDAERREQLQPLVRGHVAAVVPNLRQVRSAHRALRNSLLAEPFEQAAVVAALANVREQLHASQVASHEAFAKLAAALTPTERALLVSVMERPRGPRRNPPGLPGGGPPPTSGKMFGPAAPDVIGVGPQSPRAVRLPISSRLPAADGGF